MTRDQQIDEAATVLNSQLYLLAGGFDINRYSWGRIRAICDVLDRYALKRYKLNAFEKDLVVDLTVRRRERRHMKLMITQGRSGTLYDG